MDASFVVLLAIGLGLAAGSFLNVLITRLPDQGRTLFSPARSHCPKCDSLIMAKDNIPILSWLLLRGRCRSCGLAISAIYPFVELLSAVAAGLAALAWLTGILTGVAAFALWLFAALLIVIAVTDSRWFLIPDAYTVGGAVAGLACLALSFGFPAAGIVAGEALMAGAVLYLLGFLVSQLRGIEALGMGDAFMVAMMAPFLAYGGSAFGGVLIAIYVGALSGGVAYVLQGQAARSGGSRVEVEEAIRAIGDTPRSEDTPLIPFGLHLAIGGAVTLVGLLFVPVVAEYAALIDGLLPWHS